MQCAHWVSKRCMPWSLADFKNGLVALQKTRAGERQLCRHSLGECLLRCRQSLWGKMLKNLPFKARGEGKQSTVHRAADWRQEDNQDSGLPNHKSGSVSGTKWTLSRTKDRNVRVEGAVSWRPLQTDHNLHFLRLYSLGLKIKKGDSSVLCKGNREKARIQTR